MLSPTGKHLPSINKYRKDIGLDIKGISVGHHNIRIFTRFQGAYPVSHTNMLSGMNGYGFQSFKLIHPSLDRQACAESKILLRDKGSISNDGNMAAPGRQYARCVPGFVSQLKLVCMAQRSRLGWMSLKL